MSCLKRKPAFCIYKNKELDQLHGNSAADHQRLCFCYIDSTITLLPKSEISNLQTSSVAVIALFVSELVGNPEDRFSHDPALIKQAKSYVFPANWTSALRSLGLLLCK